jgi:hypothetical protein
LRTDTAPVVGAWAPADTRISPALFVLRVIVRKSAFRALPVMNTLERQTILERAPALGAG